MAYSPLGNPAAPPTRKWEKDSVPLIKGNNLPPVTVPIRPLELSNTRKSLNSILVPFPVREIFLVQFLKGENSDPTVALIAESHGKTSAQVLIRYAIDRGLIVIPKSVTPERLAANADVFDFQLSNDEVSTLLGLERGFRVVEIEANKNHKYYPWRENYAE